MAPDSAPHEFQTSLDAAVRSASEAVESLRASRSVDLAWIRELMKGDIATLGRLAGEIEDEAVAVVEGHLRG